MASNGKHRGEFNSKAPPWGDTLPQVQKLPEITWEELADELKKRGKKPVGNAFDEEIKKIRNEKICALLMQDAKKVDKEWEKIAPFIANVANNDLLLDGIVNNNICRTACRRGKLKEKVRILKKSSDEYDGHIENVTDMSRCSIDAKTPEELAALCVAIEWLAYSHAPLPGGARIVAVDNRFQKPTGSRYRSFKAIIAIPLEGEKGRYHLAELMVTHKQFEKDITMIRGKELKGKSLSSKDWHQKTSHGIYEIIRFLEEKYRNKPWPLQAAKFHEKYRALITRIHDKAAARNGLLDIGPHLKRFWDIRLSASRPQNPAETMGFDHT